MTAQAMTDPAALAEIISHVGYRSYHGIREGGGKFVAVRSIPGAPTTPFLPDQSDGLSGSFDWGYSGTGSARLAFAILSDAAGPEVAARMTVAFRWGVIATLPDHWVLTQAEVLAWVAGNSQQNS